MSDLSRWDELIFKALSSDGSPYIMVPMNEYKLGNLLGLLKRSKQHDNGDWFDEFIHVITATMRRMNINELRNNFGDVFTRDDLWSQVHAPVKDGFK